MAILPETTIDLSQGVVFEDWPSHTFYADPATHRITGMADGKEAVKQTIEIILNVERFHWQIYSPYFGMQWEGLIGQNPGYVAAELQRRVRDAFSVDSRILGIEDFTYTVSGETLTAAFTVKTVYGDVPQTVEVSMA